MTLEVPSTIPLSVLQFGDNTQNNSLVSESEDDSHEDTNSDLDDSGVEEGRSITLKYFKRKGLPQLILIAAIHLMLYDLAQHALQG